MDSISKNEMIPDGDVQEEEMQGKEHLLVANNDNNGNNLQTVFDQPKETNVKGETLSCRSIRLLTHRGGKEVHLAWHDDHCGLNSNTVSCFPATR